MPCRLLGKGARHGTLNPVYAIGCHGLLCKKALADDPAHPIGITEKAVGQYCQLEKKVTK